MNLTGRIAEFLKKIFFKNTSKSDTFTNLYVRFQEILASNNKTMEIIADMEDKLSGQYVFDSKYMEDSIAEIKKIVLQSAYNFNFITDNKYHEIYGAIEELTRQLEMKLAGQIIIPNGKITIPLGEIQEAMDEAVGNKAYNLSRIMNLPQINVPESFVVSIGGFRNYLAYNNLYEKIEHLLNDLRQGASSESVSRQIKLLILNGDIPSGLRKEILESAESIVPDHPEAASFAVRSSAVGEDGAQSFAGLHDSYLNVSFRELLSSYKKVIASIYNSESLTYRLHQQLPLGDIAMAVLYQKMIPGSVSGVAYTVDPNAPQDRVCILGANWGLGKAVVEGNAAVDTFKVSRKAPYPIVDQTINEKKWMVSGSETTLSTKISKDIRSLPCLTTEQASLIIEESLVVERYFKRPIDIEWCLDSEDKITFLQARPLGIRRPGRSKSKELQDLLKKQKILMKEQGAISYRGIGSGKVYIVNDKEDINKFPNGGVLVSRYAIPMLSGAIHKASAVITDVGSPTGHMATVAREFQIPTIVDTGSATQVLKQGQEVTVDAEKNIIYEGRINELMYHQLLDKPIFDSIYEFQILRRLLRKLSPLTLLDPEDTNFTIKGCTTIHDVIRFMHEKSINSLQNIAQKPSKLLARGGKRLKSNLPLNLILIDIGGGLAKDLGKAGWIPPEQIESLPMNALWEGLSSENLWSTRPVTTDFKGLMSGVTRTQAATVAGQTISGLNLAVLGSTYMNLTLRVGYHFTVVDSMLCPLSEKNTIFFRFVGGATDLSRRSRRATLIVRIMEKIGFKVEGNGDLVIARAASPNSDQIKKYLYLTGRLIGFVRQLDILMTNDSAVDHYFEQFMTENNITDAT